MSVDSSKVAHSPQLNGALAALLLLLGLFLGSQFLAGLVVYLAFGLVGINSAVRDTLVMSSATVTFLFIIIYHLIGYSSLASVARRMRLHWGDLGIRRPQWPDATYAVIGYAAYYVAFMLLALLLQKLTPIDLDQKQNLPFDINERGTGLALASVALVIFTPIFEELFFRGFFFGRLRQYGFTFMWAAVSTSLVFGLLHLFGGVDGLLWIALFDTLLLSMVLCYVRERTGRVWACMAIHALKNTVAFVSLFLLSNA